MSEGRTGYGRAIAPALCLVGGAAVLLAGGRPWARGEVVLAEALPPTVVAPTGQELSSLAIGLGLVGLAGAAAFLAIHGRARRLVGGLLVVAGAGAIIDALLARTRVSEAVATAVPGASSVELTITGWPWLAVAGGAAIALGGGFALARSGGLAGTAWRYERAARIAPDRDDPGGLWRALDRGEDPTLDEGR
jgi:uncharacterized membrane protein (TIGR02234 family)